MELLFFSSYYYEDRNIFITVSRDSEVLSGNFCLNAVPGSVPVLRFPPFYLRRDKNIEHYYFNSLSNRVISFHSCIQSDCLIGYELASLKFGVKKKE